MVGDIVLLGEKAELPTTLGKETLRDDPAFEKRAVPSSLSLARSVCHLCRWISKGSEASLDGSTRRKEGFVRFISRSGAWFSLASEGGAGKDSRAVVLGLDSTNGIDPRVVCHDDLWGALSMVRIPAP